MPTILNPERYKYINPGQPAKQPVSVLKHEIIQAKSSQNPHRKQNQQPYNQPIKPKLTKYPTKM